MAIPSKFKRHRKVYFSTDYQVHPKTSTIRPRVHPMQSGLSQWSRFNVTRIRTTLSFGPSTRVTVQATNPSDYRAWRKRVRLTGPRRQGSRKRGARKGWYRAVYGRKGCGTHGEQRAGASEGGGGQRESKGGETLACNEGVAADHTRPKNTLSTKPTPFCTLLPSPPPGGNESFIARYLFRPPLAVKSRGDRKRRHGNFVSVFSTTMKTSRQIDECHIFRERT
ncbi:hypothetical protein ALC56_12762 [Trachymyrmex septentrionalis]|uniref:Uncharacterized protein n=1 Tax=Trachymyrmex septentrionalis TaxID=34720 RepID=A0A195EXS0_9HYME|nr:hypothetical protein ALC56_12762 [Trachymyrmex septentrionalis]